MIARLGRTIVAGTVVVAVASAWAGDGPRDKVWVETTGDNSEERKTIPIAKQARGARRVAISMSPKQIPDLKEGDRLRISAELEVTNNCRQPSPLCVSRPYSFSPRVGTQLVLANGPEATDGPGAMPLTSRRQLTCRQAEPNREHHCVSVFAGVRLKLGDESALPCRLENCRINLVADAHHRKAREGDVVILGVDRRGHEIHQDRGRINIARFRNRKVQPKPHKTSRRLHNWVDVERSAKVSIYSLQLKGLRRGEQLTFDATATADVDHLPYSTFTGSQLVLARRPGAVRSTSFMRRVATNHGEINEKTGFNCTQLTTPCPQRRVGVIRMRRTPRRHGRVVSLYVNYVFRNAPKRADDRPGDRIRIRPGGGIVAKRYPASALG